MAKTIDRKTILQKTLWGVDIYAHILRRFYPDQTVLKIVGRDCGIARNPFNGGTKTLRIWFRKNDPDATLSDETAFHHDESGTIPDDDALDFAARYYGQSGQELLETLNREMYLHLDGSSRQYASTPAEPVFRGPEFSFFKAPINNIHPYKNIRISDAYNYIVGPYAKARTEELRNITDKKRARLYKAARFDYATFCGTFKERNDAKAISVSGLICLDFDHLPQLEELFGKLLQDNYFETVLLFRSPSGDGLKWVIEISKGNYTHADYFLAISSYISATYGIAPDCSGKDLSRACFLPYDPQAYINPKFV